MRPHPRPTSHPGGLDPSPKGRGRPGNGSILIFFSDLSSHRINQQIGDRCDLSLRHFALLGVLCVTKNS